MSPAGSSSRNVALLLGIVLLAGASLVAPALAQDANETGSAANETGTDANASAGDDAGAGSGGDAGIPTDAPAPAEGHITRILTFGVIEESCPGGAPAPCWDVVNLVASPGDVVVLRADLTNSDIPHNLHLIEAGAEPAPSAAGPKTRTSGAALHVVSGTMPEQGALTFICDVHPDTMRATVVTPAAAATSGAHGAAIPALGVHFLAYWVGVIAFAILFIMYGLTFFLFKYNETRATTDHWDRSEPDGGSKRLAAIAPLLAVVIAVAAIAAIVFVTMR